MFLDSTLARRGRTTASALVITIVFLAAGCGEPTSAAPSTTSAAAGAEDSVAPTTDEDPTTTGGDTTTDADEAPGAEEEVEAEEVIGPPLPPRSSAAQILEVVGDMHGPTGDVAGQMNRLVDFPAVPTPPGAAILEIRVDVRQTIGGEGVAVLSEVLLRSSAPIEELVGFYETELGELGWTQTTEATAGLGPRRRLGFEIPATDYERDDVEVDILSTSGDPDGGAEVRIAHVELAEVESDLPRELFGGWVGDLPLPEGGLVTGAGIQTSNVGRQSLHYSLTVRHEGVEPDELASLLRDGLPSDEYALDPQPSLGPTLDAWVYLQNDFFDEARISPHPIGPIDTPTATVLNLYARVEFSSDD